MAELDKLLYLRGIAASYLDYFGQYQQVSPEDRLQVLQLCGHDVTDAEAIDEAVERLDAQQWRSWLQPCYVLDAQQPLIEFHCHPQEIEREIEWTLTTEAGAGFSGVLHPSALAETGEYYLDDVRWVRYGLPFPALPGGYHNLTFSREKRQEHSQIIAAPPHCFSEFREPSSAKKIWGVTCQVYTLRSARNWGIGDLTDLCDIIKLSAKQGADVVAINPMHAPYLNAGEYASPYSPSDRRFLNPVYLDPEAIEDFANHATLKEWRAGENTQRQLERLRASKYVDYDAVNKLKYSVFEKIYADFRRLHLQGATERGKEFERYVAAQGDALGQFSRFEADNNRFAVTTPDDPVFFQYLQWLMSVQLDSCQQCALSAGMRVGLMRDVAIGSIAAGAEVACNTTLYNTQLSIGAPPDPFAKDGQDWNLPPPDPVAMRETRYRHFIQLLRSNMASCGAVRIDHVMGLMRLWWCLPDSPARGVYVYYPFDELWAILRLESQRNRCRVIGEDMGVVPDLLRAAMHATHVFSNKLFYFETHLDGSFKLPTEYQEDALLMVTNHDVPTLAGWWQSIDIEWQKTLQQFDDEPSCEAALQQRSQQKLRLLEWLDEQRLLPAGWSTEDRDTACDLPLCAAIHRALARGNSLLLLLQLEDLQLITEPVNIPGTWREYPNWRRKQAADTEELLASEPVKALLHAVNSERQH